MIGLEYNLKMYSISSAVQPQRVPFRGRVILIQRPDHDSAGVGTLDAQKQIPNPSFQK